MTTAQAPTLDMSKLNIFIGQFVTDLGASVHAGMVVIGEKLGLYKALAEGPVSPAELARKTGTDERYIRERFRAGGRQGVRHLRRFEDLISLSEEQAFTLAQEDRPAYISRARLSWRSHRWLLFPVSPNLSAPAAVWGGIEHDDGVFHGCEKFFRPGYAANLCAFLDTRPG